jgi:hypothetical protein
MILAGHEHKACTCTKSACSACTVTDFSAIVIPYNHIPSSYLSTPIDMQRIILSPNLLDRTFQQLSLDFYYAIYALGSHLPSSIDLWRHQKEGGARSTLESPEIPTYGGTKPVGISSLRERQRCVESATSMLVVGAVCLVFVSHVIVTPNDASNVYLMSRNLTA